MSELAKSLELTEEEFIILVANKRPKMRKALKKVIFESESYKDAGRACGITAQAIYDHLKKMYKNKWGFNYVK